jgi:hypothetical protein
MIRLSAKSRDTLHDRFRVRDVLRFLLFFMAFFVPSFVGMKSAGRAGIAAGWVIGAAVFFGFGLPAILCCHCPHYTRKGLLIVCPSTVGPPKLRRACPERPVSKAEQALFAAGFGAVLLFPFPVLILGGQVLWAGLAFMGAIVFIVSELAFSCSKCVNFSCLLNRVPEEVKAAYKNGHRKSPGLNPPGRS